MSLQPHMQMQYCIFILFHYSIGSGCPLPRSENNITASAIHTPITAPYAAIPASAICPIRV